jgi:quinol---cytochrome c reductase iron-sulfur subunit, bacillus type
VAHAEAYNDPGTPEEQSRRTFMANAVVALGGVIGLGLTIPLLVSLLPPADANNPEWSPLTPDQAAALKKATDSPVKVTFNLHEVNGYFGASDSEQFFWAVKGDEAAMRKRRPALFGGIEKVPYPVVSLGFAVFSPICPHLGCRYAWDAKIMRFACPCHGSQFTNLGEHVEGVGPALRDPLPLREFNGKVQVEWIEYKQNTPDHIILKVG